MKVESSTVRLRWHHFALVSLLVTVMAVVLGCNISATATTAKPALPLVVSYRESVLGQGKVAVFSNQSANRLTITVKVEDKTQSQKKTQTMDLDPNGKVEMGWLEGWTFESGDTIELMHPQYRTMKLTFP